MKKCLEKLTKEEKKALEEEWNEYLKQFGEDENTCKDLYKSLDMYISDFVKEEDWDKLTFEDMIDIIR